MCSHCKQLSIVLEASIFQVLKSPKEKEIKEIEKIRGGSNYSWENKKCSGWAELHYSPAAEYLPAIM